MTAHAHNDFWHPLVFPYTSYALMPPFLVCIVKLLVHMHLAIATLYSTAPNPSLFFFFSGVVSYFTGAWL